MEHGFSTRRFLPSTSMLLAFDMAARTGSFTSAARELNLTQGAVSKQIIALEELLGVELFERAHHTVTLTDAGRTYAKDLEGALGLLKSRSGAILVFSEEADLPPDALASGYRHEIREVWVAESDIEVYLYVVYDDQRVERWPRAEIPCE